MEQLYRRIFHALPVRRIATAAVTHRLTARELSLIRRTEIWAMVAAVLIELASHLGIFLPLYAFPDFFASLKFTADLPLLPSPMEIAWGRPLWMLTITLLELYVLLLVNLAAVHGIAVATGYIRRDKTAAETSGLIRIALGQKFDEQQQFGIDPFEGMSRWLLYGYLLLNRLKGMIGTALMRALLRNLFGRELLRIYLDFAGMPVYMAINAYSTYAILRHARVMVMGQTSIALILQELPDLELDDWERDLVYDTLQFIAVSKRDFHANHFYLTRAIVDHFGIPVEPAHPLAKDYFLKLKQAPEPVADLCRLLIVLGFVMDGRISGRERAQLRRLREQGILDLDAKELGGHCRNFLDGQGLSGLTGRRLAGAKDAPAGVA